MVGLHVLDDQIIGSTSRERICDIAEPYVSESCVDTVHDRDLLVDDRIRIISHAVRDGVLSFKEIDLTIIHTYVSDVICNVHRIPPKRICMRFILLSCLCI